MPKKETKERTHYKDKYSYEFIVNALERALKTKKLITINDLCILYGWDKKHWYTVINDFKKEEELSKTHSERKITELHSLILLKEEETLRKLCYQSPSALVFLLKCNFGYNENSNDEDKKQDNNLIKALKSLRDNK